MSTPPYRRGDDEFGALYPFRVPCESYSGRRMSADRKIALLTAALWLVTASSGRAQLVTAPDRRPDFNLHVSTNLSGEVSVSAWSRDAGWEGSGVLEQVIHCHGSARTEGPRSDTVVCSSALRRDGLALEAVVDVAPIAQRLNATTGMELWLHAPRLGFDSVSLPMSGDEEGSGRISRSIRFEAGKPPQAIHLRFGYLPDQLAGIYLPLLALALALVLISVAISRAGLEVLSRSAVLLGTMIWMAAAAQFQADAPLRILLFGTPYAHLAALLVDFWPPLLCVGIGVALGNRIRANPAQSGRAGAVLQSLAVIPLLLTCAVGAFPWLNNGSLTLSFIWLAAAPIILLLRRFWLRAKGRFTLRQVSSGELKQRLSALAAQAGCPQVKVYISFSTRSDHLNAFALPRRSIFLTAPLIRSLSKREVDAVAAHELSHFRHSNRAVWLALMLAMVMCETPIRDQLVLLPGGLFAAVLLPIAVFVAGLRGMRKCEFAADANAAALTGDPRAMISSLARIARKNGSANMNAVAEWFSSHPSTLKRIRALAAAARLDAAEVDSLCNQDDRGDRYQLPQEESDGPIFTPGWQTVNAGIYGWVTILGSCGAGLSIAWLLIRFGAFNAGEYGVVQVIAGIAIGCIFTKGLAATLMAMNYARLRRKLQAKLGIGGQLVGLAMDGEARLYNGFRFSDAGLFRFERGRLCYQSERVTIALNPADVAETGMVAASPSNWIRKQPMVRFRQPETGKMLAFILHPVDWLPAQRLLLRSIERWRVTEGSQEKTSISGFNPGGGQPFTNPTFAGTARGFLVPGCVTFVAAVSGSAVLDAQWWYAGCALAVAASSYAFMLLPALLYRSPALPPELSAPVDAS